MAPIEHPPPPPPVASQLITKHCLNDNPVSFQIQSDQTSNFVGGYEPLLLVIFTFNDLLVSEHTKYIVTDMDRG